MGVGETDSIKDYIVIFFVIVFFGGTLVVPILNAILLVLFAVVFVLLSPVAALVSGVLAYRRGLNAVRYAAVGLLYSVMLGFPWLFLTLGMIDRSLPRVIIRILYFFTYAGWLIGIPAVFLFAMDINQGVSPLETVLILCFVIANGILWIFSLYRLSQNGVAGEEFSEERAFPYLWNTLPFACISVLIAFPLILLTLAAKGWSVSELVQGIMTYLENMLRDILNM